MYHHIPAYGVRITPFFDDDDQGLSIYIAQVTSAPFLAMSLCFFGNRITSIAARFSVPLR
jgi:hypothetical protein